MLGEILDEWLPLGFAWLLLGGAAAIWAFSEGDWPIGLALLMFSTVVLGAALWFSSGENEP